MGLVTIVEHKTATFRHADSDVVAHADGVFGSIVVEDLLAHVGWHGDLRTGATGFPPEFPPQRAMDVAACGEGPLTSSMLWNRFKNRVDALSSDGAGSSTTVPANFDALCRDGTTAEFTAQISQE